MLLCFCYPQLQLLILWGFLPVEQQQFYTHQCRGRRLSSVIGAHDAWAVMNGSLIFRLCAICQPAAIDTFLGEACFFFFSSSLLLFADRNRPWLPAPLHYLATGFHRLLRLCRLICRGSERIVSCLMNPVTQSLSQLATAMHADKLTRRVASTPFFFLNFIFLERSEGQWTRLSRRVAHNKILSDLMRPNSWLKVAWRMKDVRCQVLLHHMFQGKKVPR